jgi:hypothetical protein
MDWVLNIACFTSKTEPSHLKKMIIILIKFEIP